EIGRFWLESSPVGWSRIAATLAKSRNLNGWDQARLLALVHIAVADSYFSSFDSKYFYNFWRPMTAVRLADSDGNPDTVGDPTWQTFDPVTPPVPDYPSAHACAGGAAAAVMRGVFASDDIAFSQTSTSLPGVTRKFAKLSQAATENNLSRIYVGYHFRLATDEGLKMGDQLGKLVVQSRLQPL
ncbi:MAG: vanadium-dependent haloperoxidase, partial [Casimicrobium sp.]